MRSRPEEEEMPSIIELKKQRAALVTQAREMLDAAEGESRDFSSEEQKSYDRVMADVESVGRRIEREDEAREQERRLALANMPGAADENALLSPEMRMTDWVRARGGTDSGEEFSLGRLIRARVTGESHFLTERERRAMAEGTDAAGGVLIPEELSGQIIDRARAQSVVFRAGAQTAPMESDTLVLARMTGGNVAAWKAENAAVTESDQVWERVELKSKTVVVLQRMSRELFEDLSPQGESAIRNEIASAIALKLDLAALEGSGTAPEPRGISETTGVNSISMTTNGAKPTSYDEVVKAHFANVKANASGSTAAVFHPRDLETYALLKDNNLQPLTKPEAIREMLLLGTTQISTTRTQGTSTDCSNGYVADFRELIVGLRPSLQVRFRVLEDRYADNLQVGMIAWLRGDVALAHPAFFTKIIGIKP
jgi:HK97 family phage major capsid protein